MFITKFIEYLVDSKMDLSWNFGLNRGLVQIIIDFEILDSLAESNDSCKRITDLKILEFPLQLDSADEQAAAIRRELDGRMQKVNEMERVSQEHFSFLLK